MGKKEQWGLSGGTHHWLVGLDPGDDGLEPFVLLPLPELRVDVGDEGVDALVHQDEIGSGPLVLRLLEDGPQQQRVLGQALHGADQDVQEAKAVAVALRLTPLRKDNV